MYCQEKHYRAEMGRWIGINKSHAMVVIAEYIAQTKFFHPCQVGTCVRKHTMKQPFKSERRRFCASQRYPETRFA